VQEFTATYMPFWLFEVEVNYWYNCTMGYTDKILGKSHCSIKTPTYGRKTKNFNDVLFCASDCAETKLLELIHPWRIDQLQRFTLQHAENTEVRAFTVTADDAWERVKGSLDQRTQRECEQDLRSGKGSERIGDLMLDITSSRKRARRLFVPVYITTVEYCGSNYLFLINGSTARVHGQRPYSTGKLASLSFTGIGAAIGLITTARLRL